MRDEHEGQDWEEHFRERARQMGKRFIEAEEMKRRMDRMMEAYMSSVDGQTVQAWFDAVQEGRI